MLDRARKAARDRLVRAVAEALEESDRRSRDRHEALRAELRDELDRTREALVRSVRDLEHRRRHDLVFAADEEAARDSARFVAENLPTVPWCEDPHATLRHGLSLVEVDGLALEFGVATGTTLGIVVGGLPDRTPYGFDSFEGLPEAWRAGFPAGEFAQPPPEVPGAELVVGLFADTLPGFLAEHPGPVAFLHVDCDLRSATETVLAHVAPRLVAGSVVVFDEYLNYPGWRDGEHRAWRDLVERTGLEFSYEAWTIAHEQLVVRVTSPGRA